jgi:hypothetical protein
LRVAWRAEPDSLTACRAPAKDWLRRKRETRQTGGSAASLREKKCSVVTKSPTRLKKGGRL